MRIAISGKSGCGNTTVSALLAQKLGIPVINYTFRSLAADLGLSFEEVRRLAETSDEYDRMIDSRQVELAREGPCVLASRLAIWMLEEADFRVFLDASEETRAARIQGREGGGLEDIRGATRKRDAADSARYRRLYGIDNGDTTRADLVIDTERRSPEEIAALIVAELRRRGLVPQTGAP
ncbi:MAG: cytidylate kinase family protein [Spirochaetaceae bacterium]|nr:cytidylate kinase family protein [Spirochaetaceae bacterium]